VLPDGRAIDLSRRKNVVAILAALARERRMKPGSPISADALLAAGWPGERMRAEAATKRLHTAIWTLRSLGLEGILLTKDDGYLLDPSVPAEIEGL
jgi:DNA-binding SARP family transcriptional activator